MTVACPKVFSHNRLRSHEVRGTLGVMEQLSLHRAMSHGPRMHSVSENAQCKSGTNHSPWVIEPACTECSRLALRLALSAKEHGTAVNQFA